MKTSKYEIRGLTPLLMHNGQLADPLNPATQALAKLTANKKKTEQYHLDVRKCEWYGSLYLDDDGEPCIPGEVLESCIVDGAKKYKLGKAAKGGIVVPGDSYPLRYTGPRDPDKLWAGGDHIKVAGVRVGQARVIRARPYFAEWSCAFELQWDPDIIKDQDQLDEIVDSAGMCGIGDWRPKYGRFEVL